MNDLSHMPATLADSASSSTRPHLSTFSESDRQSPALSDSHRRWLRLVNSRGFGPVKLALAADLIHSTERPSGRSAPGVSSCSLTAVERARVMRCMSGIEAVDMDTEQVIAVVQAWLLSAADHALMTLLDDDYPPLLKQLRDPPPVLYLKGRRDLLAYPQIAIVGSRRASRQGLHIASAFARELSTHGFTITSGLAQGIDTAAHQGSVDIRTIAVLGCGTDVVYPPANRCLQNAVGHDGLLVSEFPPGTQPAPHHFPRRNRIIAGLALGTLVVEAGVRSGSLHTAMTALQLGREVMAIPGSIYSTESRGCHSLIKQGAALVETAKDIVQRLGGALETYRHLYGLEPGTEASQSGSADRVLESKPQGPASIVLDALGAPKDLDELVCDTGLDVSELMQVLLSLELDDLVIQDGGRYQLAEFALK